MKESLDIESRDSLIAYRIERVYGSLQEAKLMAEGGFYNASINRLYYACYYMAVALLLKNNISAQTHSGVKTMLGMHFTSKGKLSISASKIFTTLMTESADPKRYWSVLKTRLKKEGAEPTTICSTLKMLAWDGKMRLTDVADQEQMFRLIQSIPSPKAEPFKLWMAQVASERLDEMQEGLLYMLLKNKPHSRFQKLKIMTRAGEWV